MYAKCLTFWMAKAEERNSHYYLEVNFSPR